jgi:GTPase SAR1 family protein
MGALLSKSRRYSKDPKLNTNNKQISSQIDRKVSQLRKEEDKRFKLLLLGTGESGKSTFMKQFTYLFGEGFTQQKLLEYAPVVVDNVVSFMQAICRNMHKYEEEFKSEQDLKEEIDAMLNYKAHRFLDRNIAMVIQKLWQDQAVRQVYAKYHNVFHVPESAPYFFEQVERYVDPEFVPNKDDLINVRARTTGVQETDIKYRDSTLRFVDVGGQRTERNKWIHCFEDVTAILYVVAISEFDQLLYEDDKTNRLDEAIKVFENTINSQWLKNTPIIIFFNKFDVLEEKLKTVKLNSFFKNYGDENSADKVIQYFKNLFLSTNLNKERDIYCYESCATRNKNVEAIFNALNAIVLTKNLLMADEFIRHL